jgi:5-methylcytosine-specific restriction endonuclease McrA
MGSTVYVLNNSFECVSQTSFSRARTLVEDGKAEVVKWTDRVISSAKGEFRIPKIIRIFRYVRAYGRAMKFHKRFVWERDDYVCQYCEKKILSKSDLQTDHVFPESRGGKATYENMVTACAGCNSKKDNRTPEEAGMRLIREPVKPQISRSMKRIAEETRLILAEEDGWA